MFDLKIKPYGECIKDDLSVENFEEDNWELVVDLFLRLSKKFETFYPNVKILNLVNTNPYIIITIDDNNFTEEELVKYSTILSGNTTENIIYFGEHEFIIRSEIVINERKLSFLDKFNSLILDVAPDLANQ